MPWKNLQSVSSQSSFGLSQTPCWYWNCSNVGTRLNVFRDFHWKWSSWDRSRERKRPATNHCHLLESCTVFGLLFACIRCSVQLSPLVFFSVFILLLPYRSYWGYIGNRSEFMDTVPSCSLDEKSILLLLSNLTNFSGTSCICIRIFQLILNRVYAVHTITQ
jgi:hypothetical protein